MIRLEDRGRQYKRFRPSSDEKIQLSKKGLQWVLSSNVSALGVDGEDLIVRFHNGSLYRYFKVSKLFNSMLQSNSKGKFVWARLRRKNVPYKKIGSMPLESDIPISDEDLFENIDTEGIRVESPQVLDTRDIIKSPNIFNVAKVAASILILDDILGIEIIPKSIIGNIKTNTSL